MELLKIISIFFLGSVFTRSAGCIINDIFDQNFDALVERTKNRPLARGTLTNKDAIIFLVIFSVLSLVILLQLNKLSKQIAIFSAMMVILYPLTKRIFKIPQLFLGITFNTGALISYASLANKIDLNSIIIYIGCAFWTLGYDTVYGFSDLKDDKKININSSAIFLEKKNFRLVISILYLLFFLLIQYIFIQIIFFHLDMDNNKIFLILIYSVILFVMFLYIVKQLKKLDYHNSQDTISFFKKNLHIGVIFSIMLIVTKILQILNK